MPIVFRTFWNAWIMALDRQLISWNWFYMNLLVLIAHQSLTWGRQITVGILTYDSPDKYAITSMEATGSAMNIAINDFQAKGWLKEHTFR